MTLYVLGTAFTLWMAVECVRRQHTSPWLWIILVFPTIGAAVYLFAEVLPSGSLFSRRPRAASTREVNHLRAEVRRLDNSDAWTNYAHALRSRKRFREALEAAENASARDRANLRALYELGLAQLSCEKFGEAVVSLSGVVEREPGHDSGEARFALATAQERSGDKEGARRTLSALAKTSSLPKVLFQLASLHTEAGNHGEARELFVRIIEESEYVPSYHRREVRPWVRKAKKALSALP